MATMYTVTVVNQQIEISCATCDAAEPEGVNTLRLKCVDLEEGVKTFQFHGRNIPAESKGLCRHVVETLLEGRHDLPEEEECMTLARRLRAFWEWQEKRRRARKQAR